MNELECLRNIAENIHQISIVVSLIAGILIGLILTGSFKKWTTIL